jgi:hypothetical protein
MKLGNWCSSVRHQLVLPAGFSHPKPGVTPFFPQYKG